MPRRQLTCDKCKETFPDNRDVDERLLQAIFGETLCPKCYALENATTCEYCNERVLGPIYLEGEPYHPACLDKVVGEE